MSDPGKFGFRGVSWAFGVKGIPGGTHKPIGAGDFSHSRCRKGSGFHHPGKRTETIYGQHIGFPNTQSESTPRRQADR